jgi:1,4-dihydroxy-2-naphthoate octaprenyltransferase
VPVRTMNVRAQNEEVTFEILDSRSVQRPSFLIVLLRLLRPQTLTFSVGTMIVAFIAAHRMKLPTELLTSVLTIFAILFFHAALNLLNDYYDHLKGHDRINPHGGSRAIQKAWIAAYQVQRLAFFFFALAFVFAVPVLMLHSFLFISLVLVSLFAGMEFTTNKIGLKNFGLGEYLVYFLTGPLLTCGFVWSITDQFVWQMLLLGSVFGASTLFFYHFSNIENILTDAQAGRKTWAVYLGIDRAKKFLWLIGGFFLLSYFSFAFVFSFSDFFNRQSLVPLEIRNFSVFVAMSVVLMFNLLLICVKVLKSPSPLSSDLKDLRHRSLRLHWLTVICMILALSDL